MSDDPDPKPFECQCGMVIGWKVRVNGITTLNVLRVPTEVRVMPQPSTQFEQAQIWAGLNVNDGDILCQHCGAINPWVANKSAVRMMSRRLGKCGQEGLGNDGEKVA